MKRPKIIRIDFRLLHGMVVTKWIRLNAIKRIIIIDNEVKEDPFLKEIFDMTKPAGTELKFFTIEEAGQYWDSDEFDENVNGNILVLFKNINKALKFVQTGAQVDNIIVGNMESAPNKKAINRVFFMDRDDIDTLDQIAATGTNIVFQELPELAPIKYLTLRERNIHDLEKN